MDDYDDFDMDVDDLNAFLSGDRSSSHMLETPPSSKDTPVPAGFNEPSRHFVLSLDQMQHLV